MNTDKSLVLAVDDDHAVIKITAIMLAHYGYNVLGAFSGEEAVELFHRHHQNLASVFLDMQMPGMSGEIVFRKMRRLDRGVPVYIWSSCYDAPRIRGLLRLGAAGFIPKPFKRDILLRALTGERLSPTA